MGQGQGTGVGLDKWARSGHDMRLRLNREAAERVVRLAAGTSLEDRELIESVYGDGMSAERVARIAGVEARAMRRRIKRIVERVTGEEYAFVVVNHKDWPPSMRRVAIACVLWGQSLRTASQQLGKTLHEVRREREAIRAVYKADVLRRIKERERALRAG